jgi:multiple sugar transport system ATP-binding protein
MPRADIDQRVREAARILQIEPLLQRKPKALSGGQRQRVAIGRAIVRHPRLFLFDEPLSNLDAELRVQMRVEIAKLHKDLGTTMIYVTHDQVEAMTMADKIVVLRGGRIEQVGAPLDLYNAPANRFVAGFIGSPRMNFLAARVVTAGADGVRLTVDARAAGQGPATLPVRGADVAPGEQVSVGIRPEHIALGRGEAGDVVLDATIDLLEQLGASSFLYCTLPGGEKLTVQMPGQVGQRAGDQVQVAFPAARAHVFRATTGEPALARIAPGAG